MRNLSIVIIAYCFVLCLKIIALWTEPVFSLLFLILCSRWPFFYVLDPPYTVLDFLDIKSSLHWITYLFQVGFLCLRSMFKTSNYFSCLRIWRSTTAHKLGSVFSVPLEEKVIWPKILEIIIPWWTIMNFWEQEAEGKLKCLLHHAIQRNKTVFVSLLLSKDFLLGWVHMLCLCEVVLTWNAAPVVVSNPVTSFFLHISCLSLHLSKEHCHLGFALGQIQCNSA